MKRKGLVGPAIKTLVSFVLAYILHTVVVGYDLPPQKGILLAVYIFHFLFALTVIIVFQLLSMTERLKDQLGFIYLGALAAKLVLFMVLFSNQFFFESADSTVSQGNFLPPVFLGLICEVIFLGRTLKGIA